MSTNPNLEESAAATSFFASDLLSCGSSEEILRMIKNSISVQPKYYEYGWKYTKERYAHELLLILAIIIIMSVFYEVILTSAGKLPPRFGVKHLPLRLVTFH